MYWRIRKHGPKEMLKQHGVHIVLAISLFFNFINFCVGLTQHKPVSAQLKTDFDAFVRKVTEHILDTSYVSYEGSTVALIDKDKGELSPSVIAAMRNQQQLPRDLAELRATEKSYTDQRRVSAIRIDEVNQSEPDSNGLVPIDVSGVVAVHSAEESDPGPVRFRFKYLVGLRGATQTPIVANFQDLSGPM
jgi:hypothetical protein